MRNRIKSLIFLAVFLSGIFMVNSLFATDLMIIDFENDRINNIGGEVGSWDSNPNDPTQRCEMSIVPLSDVMGKRTNVLKISYAVKSYRPAPNGIYIELNDADFTPYDEMSMLIKGGKMAGFTTQFRLEFKNAKDKRIVRTVRGITSEWQRVVIPLNEMKERDTSFDWSKMKEAVFIFDNLTVSSKSGVLYVDDIMVSSGKK